MKCPECNNDIMISMQDILTSKEIICPHCGLHIEIDNNKKQS